MVIAKALSILSGRFVVLLLTGMISGSCSFSQDITGTILGAITDSSGAAVTGASITVVDQNTNLEYKAARGVSEYTVTNLPPGTYSVRAELSGFRPSLTRDVVLLANRSVRVNVVLSPGSVNQTSKSPPRRP